MPHSFGGVVENIQNDALKEAEGQQNNEPQVHDERADIGAPPRLFLRTAGAAHALTARRATAQDVIVPERARSLQGRHSLIGAAHQLGTDRIHDVVRDAVHHNRAGGLTGGAHRRDATPAETLERSRIDVNVLDAPVRNRSDAAEKPGRGGS